MSDHRPSDTDEYWAIRRVESKVGELVVGLTALSEMLAGRLDRLEVLLTEVAERE